MRAVDEAEATPAEKTEMLMEIAMGLQQRPKAIDDLRAAVGLYRTALDICPADATLLSARVQARMATALMATPSEGAAYLEEARDILETALAALIAEGSDAEIAEAEMNLGLALQNLAGMQRARISDAIAAYQRSLRTFDKTRHPKEYAILQNNLAAAFMSVPFTDDSGKMREALAVQAFEEGLNAVNLIDHPSEYAMLQNNLGNALQYVSSSHPIENCLRALEAYEEALKVRTRRAAPGEYANTVSNKANCLANLPDDPARPEAGNVRNLTAAVALYREAMAIFQETGASDKAAAVADALAGIAHDIQPTMRSANG
jgi:tetratricopeptide (TPR) repeat protein